MTQLTVISNISLASLGNWPTRPIAWTTRCLELLQRGFGIPHVKGDAPVARTVLLAYLLSNLDERN